MKTFTQNTALCLALLAAAFVSATASTARADHHSHGHVQPPSPGLPEFGFVSHLEYHQGRCIISVRRGGIAQQMGLQVNDLITHINGRPVLHDGDWQRLLAQAMQQGGRVTLTVRKPCGHVNYLSWNFGGGHSHSSGHSHSTGHNQGHANGIKNPQIIRHTGR